MHRVGQHNAVFALKDEKDRYVYIDGIEIKLEHKKLTLFRVGDLKKVFPDGKTHYKMVEVLPPYSQVTRFPYGT